jgi:hypothetical protein
MKRRGRKRSWLGKCLCGVALGLGYPQVALQAQEQLQPLPITSQPVLAPNAQLNASAGTSFATNGGSGLALAGAPAWSDPISRVPNFFGSFVARGTRASRNTLTNQTLTITGGGEGIVQNGILTLGPGSIFESFDGPFLGPGGPYTLTTNVTAPDGTIPFLANENAQLTALVRANFPGARFVNGTITPEFNNDPFFGNDIVFNYLFTSGQEILVNLPNPSGGGLVGRNKYFENGSPRPQDRVYFFYNRIGGYQGLGSSFDINRFVLGFEKTFWDESFSAEVRIPFAGTANSDQVGGQDLAVDDAEFGNIGLAVRAVAYRTSTFLVSVGLGVSLPTANDSRMLIGSVPVVAIENHTCLVQPMLGAIWAPNDRFYAQMGVQMDIAPSGNPVKSLDAAGGLSRVGVLTDQVYTYFTGAVGYWIYDNPDARLTGIALQSELNYDRSFGTHDTVVNGPITVADLSSEIDFLTGSVGTVLRFGDSTYLSVSIQVPITNDRLYDWNVMAQLNYRFGAPR